jgi:hypothetical protein
VAAIHVGNLPPAKSCAFAPTGVNTPQVAAEGLFVLFVWNQKLEINTLIGDTRRLMHPGAPVLSTGGKNLNQKQVWLCRLAGVHTIYLMFDQDKAGFEAMEQISRKADAKDLKVDIQTRRCPGSDPSACLKTVHDATDLRGMLLSMFPETPMSINIPFEE